MNRVQQFCKDTAADQKNMIENDISTNDNNNNNIISKAIPDNVPLTNNELATIRKQQVVL